MFGSNSLRRQETISLQDARSPLTRGSPFQFVTSKNGCEVTAKIKRNKIRRDRQRIHVCKMVINEPSHLAS